MTKIVGEVDFNLEAVAGEDDGLLVVAPQPPLNHVRLQLDGWSLVTCFEAFWWIQGRLGTLLHLIIVALCELLSIT